MYTVSMNDIQIIRLRELAQLDQLEALLRDRLSEAISNHDRRAIQVRLIRVDRLRRLWQPKGGTIDAIHERKRHQ